MNEALRFIRTARGTQGGDPMDTILIVCGAGASSTFLASRMRSITRERGIPLSILPLNAEAMTAHLPSAAAVLIGPHLESRFDELSDAAATFGVPIALLPSNAFGPSGAEFVLGMVGELMSVESAPSDPTPAA
jgi:cellobiose PTS system EIIB component